MALVFVENHDSFSWNVIDRLTGRRDELRVVSGRDVDAVREALVGATSVVIGPGPMDPDRAGLVPLVRAICDRGLPLLGICLGHQAIGRAFGAKLTRTRPMHGRRDVAQFTSSRFFGRFVGAQTVMRYHSLRIEEVASPLQVIATTADGTVMAVEHETLPVAGLQFHPDSFATPRGAEMIAAFFEAVS